MRNYRSSWMWLMIMIALVASQLASAQILTGEALKKVVPTTYFFAGQSAAVQARNSVALKAGSHFVLAGMVDTSGYSTAIQDKYQGFLITETKLTFDGSTLDPGQYGFGFKDGKFLVMNVASTDLFSVSTRSDDQVKHPVPLKLEKDGDGYRLYAGKNYVAFKAE
jgi:hypothetical protein